RPRRGLGRPTRASVDRAGEVIAPRPGSVGRQGDTQGDRRPAQARQLRRLTAPTTTPDRLRPAIDVLDACPAASARTERTTKRARTQMRGVDELFHFRHDLVTPALQLRR